MLFLNLEQLFGLINCEKLLLKKCDYLCKDKWVGLYRFCLEYLNNSFFQCQSYNNISYFNNLTASALIVHLFTEPNGFDSCHLLCEGLVLVFKFELPSQSQRCQLNLDVRNKFMTHSGSVAVLTHRLNAALWRHSGAAGLMVEQTLFLHAFGYWLCLWSCTNTASQTVWSCNAWVMKMPRHESN